MGVEEIALSLFKDCKRPADLNLVPVKHLHEVYDSMTIYFINRNLESISALSIDTCFPIDKEKTGIVSGEWELGGYNRDQDCYYSMGNYPVQKYTKPQFLTQERLDRDEVLMDKIFMIPEESFQARLPVSLLKSVQEPVD